MSPKKHTSRKKIAGNLKSVVAKKKSTEVKLTSVEEAEEDVGFAPKKGKFANLLRGMKDILPREAVFWRKMYHAAEDIAEAYGFTYAETPILEDASLFTRSLGRGSDVI